MTYTYSRYGREPWLGALLALLVACEQQATAERTLPSAAKPGPCDAPIRWQDPTNGDYLPRRVGTYCLDPTGSDRSYGEGARMAIDGICDLIDGECEIYRQHDLRRFVEIRYVDGAGSPATIELHLSKFASRELAYAMFTKRVVGDADPAHVDAPRPLAAGAAAALGIGNGYLWRGPFLVEATLSDESASSAALTERAAQLLPELLRPLGEKLPGSTDLPAPVAALPSDARLPLGVRYLADGALGVKGTGPAALGYYRQGEQRWQVVSIVCQDADQARDVLRLLGSIPGATEEKGLGDGAVRLMRATGPAAPQAEWLLAHRGRDVLGLGDESLVLREGMTAEEHRARTLTADDKRARLGRLLAERRAPKATPPAP